MPIRFNFNHYETEKSSDPIILFCDRILRGMSQMLFCNHPISGLLFLIGTFTLSPMAGFLTLSGLVIATLTAQLLRYPSYYIDHGLYGYNAALLGIYWIFFDSFSWSLFSLFIFASILTVFLEHYFLRNFSLGKLSLPIISIPSLISMWIAVGMATFFHLIPVPVPIDKLEITTINFFSNPDYPLMFDFIWEHAGGLILFMAGILFYSRISCLYAASAFLLSACISLYLGGNSSLYWNDIFYNLVPLSIAMGGFYFVSNKSIVLYTILAMGLTTTLLYYAHNFFQPYGLPVLIYPFNLVCFMLILPFTKGFYLENLLKIYRVPLLVLETPEKNLEWHREKMESYQQWKKIQSMTKKEAA